jgi:hypothetical protein
MKRNLIGLGIVVAFAAAVGLVTGWDLTEPAHAGPPLSCPEPQEQDCEPDTCLVWTQDPCTTGTGTGLWVRLYSGECHDGGYPTGFCCGSQFDLICKEINK